LVWNCKTIAAIRPDLTQRRGAIRTRFAHRAAINSPGSSTTKKSIESRNLDRGLPNRDGERTKSTTGRRRLRSAAS
jgi:hypothetical protein